MKKILLFVLISFLFLLNHVNVNAQTPQTYSIQQPYASPLGCYKDTKSTLTFDQCQAQFHAEHKFSVQQPLGSPKDCYLDDSKGISWDKCQSQLRENGYTLKGTNGNCLPAPAGTTGEFATLADCQASIHVNKIYSIFTPAPGYGNPYCIEDPQGAYTWEECQSIVQNVNLQTTGTPPSPPCAQFSSDGKQCLQVDTAIGALKTDPTNFVASIFSLLLGISGGIALILIIISGYRLMSSQGNPEQVQGAREMLTSAIVGLLFIIFSFVILQIIGVTILHIPGFK